MFFVRTGRGALVLTASLLLGIIGGLCAWTGFYPRSGAPVFKPSVSPSPLPASLSPANSLAGSSLAAPAVDTPPPRFLTEAEATAYAIRRFPALGIPKSAFYTEFIALHKKYESTLPVLLQDPNWPVALAMETDRMLKARPQ